MTISRSLRRGSAAQCRAQPPLRRTASFTISRSPLNSSGTCSSASPLASTTVMMKFLSHFLPLETWPSAQLKTTSWSHWRLRSACLITLRLTTTARRKALRQAVSSSPRLRSAPPSSATPRSIFLYLGSTSSAASGASQPLLLPSWRSSPSQCSSSEARRSATMPPRRAWATERCTGRRCEHVAWRTSPLLLAAASTDVRQSISSSAACLVPREVAGTILNTMFRFLCRSPAAERSVLPLSLTCFNVALNASRMPAATCASCSTRSLRSIMA
mmetsp:Transcript_183756/g.447414  ORF Transcript_183756/g.447414 Transcript_183756/m.447414 type:complete len:272 (-) Transcript_183756:390-1205(-)